MVVKTLQCGRASYDLKYCCEYDAHIFHDYIVVKDIATSKQIKIVDCFMSDLLENVRKLPYQDEVDAVFKYLLDLFQNSQRMGSLFAKYGTINYDVLASMKIPISVAENL